MTTLVLDTASTRAGTVFAKPASDHCVYKWFRFYKIFLEKEFGQTDYTGLRILAVDEIALKKGHNYMTVALDYLTGQVVWMGKGRSKETLDEFFGGMTNEPWTTGVRWPRNLTILHLNDLSGVCDFLNMAF